MGLFAVFVFLLCGEFADGEETVLLPCQYSGVLPEVNPTVIWKRYDLNPPTVHLRREKDDLPGQNQLFIGRTSMKSDALDSGDFSLTLRKPRFSDSGTYTCSISDGREELRVRDVQLEVKGQLVEVKVLERVESAVLPCKTAAHLEEDDTVEWNRFEPEFMVIHVYQNGINKAKEQDKFYRERTEMNEDKVNSGDLSLTLRDPTERDSGVYICTIYRKSGVVRQKVILYLVKASQDSLTKKVEVQWVQSVVLPCQYSQPLEEMVTVKWRRLDLNPDIVHQRREGDDLESQNELFKGRTSMRADAFDSGDFSLTLSELQLSDNGNYTCSMIDEENEITLSEVHLLVKVIPTWAIVVPILLVLLILIISGVFLCRFRHKFESARSRIILGVLIVLVVLVVSGALLYHFQYKFKSEIPSWAIFLVFLLFFLTIDVGLIHHFKEKFKVSSIGSSKWLIPLTLLLLPVAMIGFFYLLFDIFLPWIGVTLVLCVFFGSGIILFHFPCVMPERAASVTSIVMLLVVIVSPITLIVMRNFFPFIIDLPTWARILLVLFVLLLLGIDVGLLFRYFQQHFMSASTCNLARRTFKRASTLDPADPEEAERGSNRGSVTGV